MSDITLHPQALPLPAPRVPMKIRVATMADLPFMDRLQKANSKALGYFPTKQFEGYIAMGGVLVAEASSEAGRSSPGGGTLLGYIISRDRYLKRDELGVIYQLCVREDVQRGWIGAALVQAVFDRAAYGCRLFCCWCAQDLPANRFWEAMGFVPIAFRGGSMKKGKKSVGGGRLSVVGEGQASTDHWRLTTEHSCRIHIFWQKRIRRGDTTTPWWFPSKTESGALRADRLVLPIPPGVRWDEPMPVLVPQGQEASSGQKNKRQGVSRKSDGEGRNAKSCVQFGRPGGASKAEAEPAAGLPVVRAKVDQPKAKCDPKLVQAARELRDRWLERVNDDPLLLTPAAKYELARLPAARAAAVVGAGPRLLAA